MFPEAEGHAGEREGPATFQAATRRFQAQLLRQTLEETGWSVPDTARRLDLARSYTYTLIQAFAGDIGSNYLQMATYLNNFEFCSTCTQIVVMGPPSDARTQDLIKATLGRSLPNRLLMVVPPGETLPPGHPAEGKIMQNGLPTVYVCGGDMCSPPVTSAAVLSQVLKLPDNSPFSRMSGTA